MTSVDARIRARLDLVRQHMTAETLDPLGDGVSPLWNDAGELASTLLAVLDQQPERKTVYAIARNLGIEDA